MPIKTVLSGDRRVNRRRRSNGFYRKRKRNESCLARRKTARGRRGFRDGFYVVGPMSRDDLRGCETRYRASLFYKSLRPCKRSSTVTDLSVRSDCRGRITRQSHAPTRLGLYARNVRHYYVLYYVRYCVPGPHYYVHSARRIGGGILIVERTAIAARRTSSLRFIRCG